MNLNVILNNPYFEENNVISNSWQEALINSPLKSRPDMFLSFSGLFEYAFYNTKMYGSIIYRFQKLITLFYIEVTAMTGFLLNVNH